MKFSYKEVNGNIMITAVHDFIGEHIEIPAEIEGKPVTKVGESSFQNCKTIINISFPESITEIGKWAFSGCSSLTEINLPKSIMDIGRNAFSYCSNLKHIKLSENLTEISNSLFSGCETLREIEFPNGIKKIGWYAFVDCKSLMNVRFPDSVTEIGGTVFKNCSSLKIVYIADGLAEIGLNAFEACSALEAIEVSHDNKYYADKDGILYDKYLSTLICFPMNIGGTFAIPHGTKQINSNAFWGCKNLNEIIIPDSLIEIGDHAFIGCSYTSITIPDSVAKIGEWAFGTCNHLTAITIRGAGKDDINKLQELKKRIINNDIKYFSGSEKAFDFLLDQKQKLNIVLSFCKGETEYSESDKQVFDSYISKHLMEAASLLICDESIPGLNYLTNTKKITSKNINSLIEIANKEKATQALLFLMEYKNNTIGTQSVRDQFEL